MKQKKEQILSESVAKFLNFINTHRLGTVYLTDDVSYQITDVIKDNILDRNFKFSVPYYSDGAEKIYFSIPFILADATYRNTDLDTKDILVKSDNAAALDWIPLIKAATKSYLKTHDFDEVMNDVRRELIDMGHVITKEVDGYTKVTNLLNIVRPAEIMNLQDGGLAEATYLNWMKMRENKDVWSKDWDKIERIKSVADSTQRKTFRVFEWWTVDQFEVGGEMKETKGCIKYLDCTLYDPQLSDDPDNWVPYIELERFSAPDEERVKNKARLKKLRKNKIIPEGSDMEPIYPYEEQFLYKIPGRWMGMGYYELLRNEGKAFNKTMNEKLRYDELLHKGVLVHTKAPFTSNQKGSGRGLESDIMSRIQTGTMISVKAGEKIDRLNLGSLTADFLATAEKWFDLARKKVGVSEAATGGQMPSSTPATVAVVNERQAKNAFDMVNEQQGIFFKKLFTRFKIKEIIEDITEDEWTKLIGDPDELQRMEEAFIENLINVKVDEAAQTGRFVPESSVMPPAEMDRIKQAVQTLRSRQGDQRFAQIKKEMIKNFEWVVSFIITNEAFDKQIVLNAVQEAINTVSQTPMSEIDLNKLIEMKFDLMDLNSYNLRKSPQQIQADREQAIMEASGGTPASPAMVEGQGKEFGQQNQMSV